MGGVAYLKGHKNGPNVKFCTERPTWNSLFNKYPSSASHDARYNNIYIDDGYASVTSAIRVSIALTGDSCTKEQLSNATDAIQVAANDLLGVDKIIQDVRVLRDWLESIWGRADNTFYYEKTYPFRIIHIKKINNGKWDEEKTTAKLNLWEIVEPILIDRKGIFIMTGRKENLAALWDGQKLVGGYRINEWFNKDDMSTKFYFWELESFKSSNAQKININNGFDMRYNIIFEMHDTYGNSTGNVINYASCELCNRGSNSCISVDAATDRYTDRSTNQNVINVPNITDIRIKGNPVDETNKAFVEWTANATIVVVNEKTKGQYPKSNKLFSGISKVYTITVGVEKTAKYFEEGKHVNGIFTICLTLVDIKFSAGLATVLAGLMSVSTPFAAIVLVPLLLSCTDDMGHRLIDEYEARFDPSALRFTKPNQNYSKEFVIKATYLERLNMANTNYR